MIIGIKLTHRDINDCYDIKYIIDYFNKLNIICEQYDIGHLQQYNIIITDNLNSNVYSDYINNNIFNQKLIMVPTSFCHDYINNIKPSKSNIYAGFTNMHYKVNIALEKIRNKFVNTFMFPLIKFDFNHNILSKQDFYKKYNIDEQLKIIIFFDQRFDRLWIKHPGHFKNTRYENRWRSSLANQLFMMSFNHIHDTLLQCGYKLLLKTYMANINAPEYDFYKNATLIDNNNVKEMYTYAQYFIVASATTVYHTGYLYDKKTLYITHKKYDWMRLRGYQKYKSFDDTVTISNVKCGIDCYIDEFINNPIHHVNMLNNYTIPESFKTNHPIYGNSYSLTMNDYCDKLHNLIN